MSCASERDGSLESTSLSITVEDDRAIVEGIVDSHAPEVLADVLERHPSVRVFTLREIEGSEDDEANLEAARLIREAGITTLVESDGLVASGGTDLFLAGAGRIVESGACIGVHSWADAAGQEGAELPDDAPEHDPYLDYYHDMGIDEAFYWYTLDAAPSDGMHWMSRAEMEAYGLATDYVDIDGHGSACEEAYENGD